MTETLCVCPVLSQCYLVMFMIENSPKIFGIDNIVMQHETPLFDPHGGAEASCSQNHPPNIENITETQHGLSSCPSGQTGTPGHYALMKRPAAPFLYFKGVYRCSTTKVETFSTETLNYNKQQ